MSYITESNLWAVANTDGAIISERGTPLAEIDPTGRAAIFSDSRSAEMFAADLPSDCVAVRLEASC